MSLGRPCVSTWDGKIKVHPPFIELCYRSFNHLKKMLKYSLCLIGNLKGFVIWEAFQGKAVSVNSLRQSSLDLGTLQVILWDIAFNCATLWSRWGCGTGEQKPDTQMKCLSWERKYLHGKQHHCVRSKMKTQTIRDSNGLIASSPPYSSLADKVPTKVDLLEPDKAQILFIPK